MSDRKYYEAYDDRYRQVHKRKLRWASSAPSAIVGQMLTKYGLSTDAQILELGCGEGRDAVHLLRRGYQVTATDVSPEAIRYCREMHSAFAQNFRILDCVAGVLNTAYDFIYSVAVVHMLVLDADRGAFYRFIRKHLKEKGMALICTMGDGTMVRKSDISTAFALQTRTHSETGEKLQLAGTSCRMVDWESFLREIRENGLNVMEHGLTAVEPDFPVMMYAVVKKS